MKNDKMDEFFRNNQDDFDVEIPMEGHEDRFLEKLKAQKPDVKDKRKSRILYRSALAIAATFIIALGLFTVFQKEPQNNDLANVSPELSKTQDFFTTAISFELNKLNNQRSPETEALVTDALKQMQQLEKQYEILKLDLKESGQDQRVIFAMISNFQNRIDVLESVLTTIEKMKYLKKHHSDPITL